MGLAGNPGIESRKLLISGFLRSYDTFQGRTLPSEVTVALSKLRGPGFRLRTSAVLKLTLINVKKAC
jgi:hypothetical protein